LPSGLLKAKEVEEGEDEEANANKEKAEQTVERLLKLDNEREKDKDAWKSLIQGLTDIHKIDGKDVS